MKLKE